MTMRIKNINIFITIAIITFSLFVIPNTAFSLDDAIVAIVNGEVITLKELRDFIGGKLMQLKAQGKSDSEIKAVIEEMGSYGLTKLIEEKLLLDAAKEDGLEIKDDAIEMRIQALQSKYETQQMFVEELTKTGLSLTDLKNRVRDQLRTQSIVDLKVRSKVFVSPNEVTEYYNNNIRTYKRKDGLALETIFIAKGDDPQSAEKKAVEALKRINDGDWFSTVAKELSDPTTITSIEKGTLLPEIEKEVFKLKPGEVSPIIPVDNGYYIFKIKELLPAQSVSLQEAYDEIYNLLWDTKFQNKLREYIIELQNDAFIEVKR